MGEQGVVPLPRLRAAVASAVESQGLRSVARELELDHRGVGRFLDGSRPHPSTRLKLEQWYVRRAANASSAENSDAITASAALRVLLREIPSGEHQEAQEKALAALRAIYQEHGADVPSWLSSGMTSGKTE